MKNMIKLFDPVVGKEEERVLKNVLHSKFWASGAGVGKVAEFENSFNKYIGSDSCISVNSGTAALHLALSISNLKNCEVILPSLSFVSTAHAVILNGGKPKFVDVNEKDLTINVELIKKAITKKTKVVLPLHFGGMPSELTEIKKICEEFELDLIEDAAHAAGASENGKKIGTHGLAVCFSFHPVKNLAMPTGGAITLNGKHSKKFAKKLRSRRWCGIENRRGSKYEISELGWNYYMNEFSAAIGLEQLKKLEKMNSIRRNIAKKYWKELLVDKKMPYNDNCSYHLYWIRVKNRDSFMKKMTKHKIETGIHYFPIHKMKFYNDKKYLAITEKVGAEIVSLPIHPNLKESDVNKVIETVNHLV